MKPVIGNAIALPAHIAKSGNAPGQLLPPAIQRQMEALFRTSFADVRVHVGAEASSIGALAFAQGSNLHFAPGMYNPGSPEGIKLLAHELTHVVQQRAGRVHNPFGAGAAVVNDIMLEAEARNMSERAAAPAPSALRQNPVQRSAIPPNHVNQPGSSVQRYARAGIPQGKASVIQALFEGDFWHNRRKVGVEITESTAQNNRIVEMTATPAWTGLGLIAQAALWTHTVNLPDRTGAPHVWQAADYSTMNAYFTNAGGKGKWMKWNEVIMSEDYGEFEWIIEHPAGPQPVSEYRRRLTNVNAQRDVMRNAIAALPYNDVLLSMTAAGGAHEVFRILVPVGVNAVSSQITIEITEQDKALKAFQEGLTFGLERSTHHDKLAFISADAAIKTTITTAAQRINLRNVNRNLLAAYLVADLCHKMATAMTGASWLGDIASNFKGWRVLFPKSHPYQVLLMSVEGNPDDQMISRIKQQLLVARTPILEDCKRLLVTKILQRRPQLLWGPGTAMNPTLYSARADFQRLQHDLIAGAAVTNTNVNARITDLENLLDAYQAGFLVTAYNETVDALTDSTATAAAARVVRSGGFAVHGVNQKAFAFEDRGEVQDSFPNLDATYQRIVSIVDRY